MDRVDLLEAQLQSSTVTFNPVTCLKSRDMMKDDNNAIDNLNQSIAIHAIVYYSFTFNCLV